MDLTRRGCRIPQSFSQGTPHNAVRGAFTAAGATEWAVLCSISGRSRIFVYRLSAGGRTSGQPAAIDSLAEAPDAEYLQSGVEPGARFGIGFSRRLKVLSPRDLRRYANLLHRGSSPPSATRSVLEDLYVEKAATALYYANARWHTVALAE
jgi:hypothetical protein